MELGFTVIATLLSSFSLESIDFGAAFRFEAGQEQLGIVKEMKKAFIAALTGFADTLATSFLILVIAFLQGLLITTPMVLHETIFAGAGTKADHLIYSSTLVYFIEIWNEKTLTISGSLLAIGIVISGLMMGIGGLLPTTGAKVKDSFKKAIIFGFFAFFALDFLQFLIEMNALATGFFLTQEDIDAFQNSLADQLFSAAEGDSVGGAMGLVMGKTIMAIALFMVALQLMVRYGTIVFFACIMPLLVVMQAFSFTQAAAKKALSMLGGIIFYQSVVAMGFAIIAAFLTSPSTAGQLTTDFGWVGQFAITTGISGMLLFAPKVLASEGASALQQAGQAASAGMKASAVIGAVGIGATVAAGGAAAGGLGGLAKGASGAGKLHDAGQWMAKRGTQVGRIGGAVAKAGSKQVLDRAVHTAGLGGMTPHSYDDIISQTKDKMSGRKPSGGDPKAFGKDQAARESSTGASADYKPGLMERAGSGLGLGVRKGAVVAAGAAATKLGEKLPGVTEKRTAGEGIMQKADAIAAGGSGGLISRNARKAAASVVGGFGAAVNKTANIGHNASQSYAQLKSEKANLQNNRQDAVDNIVGGFGGSIEEAQELAGQVKGSHFNRSISNQAKKTLHQFAQTDKATDGGISAIRKAPTAQAALVAHDATHAAIDANPAIAEEDKGTHKERATRQFYARSNAEGWSVDRHENGLPKKATGKARPQSATTTLTLAASHDAANKSMAPGMMMTEKQLEGSDNAIGAGLGENLRSQVISELSNLRDPDARQGAEDKIGSIVNNTSNKALRSSMASGVATVVTVNAEIQRNKALEGMGITDLSQVNPGNAEVIMQTLEAGGIKPEIQTQVQEVLGSIQSDPGTLGSAASINDNIARPAQRVDTMATSATENMMRRTMHIQATSMKPRAVVEAQIAPNTVSDRDRMRAQNWETGGVRTTPHLDV